MSSNLEEFCFLIIYDTEFKDFTSLWDSTSLFFYMSHCNVVNLLNKI